ncbi:MAG: helix-turn-helix transcriptional regulator [Candidatus Limnocylindria bacterium]
MPYRIRPLDEAIRRSNRDAIELGEQLAVARRTCGATQAEVARALGWSPSRVRRIERGQRKSITHLELACIASVVGLRYSGRLFVGTTRLRDATQLEMIAGYRALAVGCGWNVRIEDPVPITGDLRAFDLMLRRAATRVAHEFTSRLYDVQAQIRPLLQKQRDAGGGTLILVIKDNAENRRLVREAGETLRDLFPLSSRDVLQAIREGRDPESNGIVFWRSRLTAAT